ncbi:alpha/beta fold hydrolase [Seohaeicola nanhaiensis]|uniref:Alpha/beta fold hydrolase n=1 Tax=Seohaeicola nanhaiensis TaxID=1387282 RepID=A0ABV9KL21_9RHOB
MKIDESLPLDRQAMNLDVPTYLHRVDIANDMSLAVTMAGEGPLVVLVHGFPESWFSWRHQFRPLVEAGYRVAALHVRGYGNSSRPEAPEAYAITEHAKDIAAVIRSLSPEGAVVIGHDWGSMQVQAAALMFPDLLRGMVTLSVPSTFPPERRPTEIWAEIYKDILFYQAYFQTPGVAEAEFEPDIERFLRLFFLSLSAEGDRHNNALLRPFGSRTLLDGLPERDSLPEWLSQEELDFYVAEFAANGLRGPLNRYRNPDLDWERLRSYSNRTIDMPALFIGGALDPTRWFVPEIDRYADPVPRLSDLRGAHILENAGHWVQQESPSQVNRLLLQFLQTVSPARE